MAVTRRARAFSLFVAVALAGVAGCSTKAPNGAAGGGSTAGGIRIGPGISGKTITLGILTDLSGVFAALGKDITQAQQLYWSQQNAKGGICGKYQVKLDVKDTGYNVQQGVQLYSSMRNDVLALNQTLGSAMNTALDNQLRQDKLVNIPQAQARSLTLNPGNAMVSATYDIEMIDGLDYLLGQGLIHQGDKIGHIYFEGEYGANAVAGSKYFASHHGMSIDEAQIKPTDADMTAQVTKFKADGVKAILLSVAPHATASAAGVAGQVGLDVPMLANFPAFAPGLLQSPAGATLKQHLYYASPVSTFDKEPALLNAYNAMFKAGPSPSPSLLVSHGYAEALVMDKILEKACSNGDLTRDGVIKAKMSLTSVDTNNLVVPLDFSKVGESPTLKTYILRAADVPGGASYLAGPYQGDDVTGYKPVS